ncbi:hypothetical protein [Hyphobacterium sp.]|uniref:hypothetical protein n=1 Tax=Hyphobacterium sp. TaxID=2004662 RepID=UPI003BAAEF8A
MNPLAIVTPIQRAAPAAFLIGLVILAVADAAKTWFGTTLGTSDNSELFGYLSMALFFLLVVFVSFLFINRRRDADRGIMLFLLPVIVAALVSMIASGILAVTVSIGLMGEYAESIGRDFQTVAQDPAMQEDFQAWLEENTAMAQERLSPAAWVGFGGFWAVTFLFGFWFASMKREDDETVA